MVAVGIECGHLGIYELKRLVPIEFWNLIFRLNKGLLELHEGVLVLEKQLLNLLCVMRLSHELIVPVGYSRFTSNIVKLGGVVVFIFDELQLERVNLSRSKLILEGEPRFGHSFVDLFCLVIPLNDTV